MKTLETPENGVIFPMRGLESPKYEMRYVPAGALDSIVLK